MGGHAFDPEGISTPRMPPEIYFQVKARMLSIFRQHFRYADSPIEAPAKQDYGDIDILVTEPFDTKAVRDPEHLAAILGAKRWKRTGGSDTTNFAIPWPPTANPVSPSRKRPHSSSGSILSTTDSKLDATTGLPLRPKPSNEEQQKFIQLDLNFVPDPTSHSWMLFLHAHGDLWSVLGSMLRRYALTCTPGGFYIYVPEIEGNKNLSRVKITDNPKLVLGYLGLDEGKYWGVFGSWDDMLDYVCTSRFVDLGRAKRREEYERKEAEEERLKLEKEREDAVKENIDGEEGETKKKDDTANTLNVNNILVADSVTPPESSACPTPEPESQAKDVTTVSSSSTKTTSAAMTRKKLQFPTEENGGLALKSNDRSRASKRPLFAYFLTTYLPAHADNEPGSATRLTKQEVVDDAKKYFGQEFAERYEEKRSKGMQLVGVAKLWSNVREMVKGEGGEGGELGYGMKGVKGMVCGEEWAWVDALEDDVEQVDGGKVKGEGFNADVDGNDEGASSKEGAERTADRHDGFDEMDLEGLRNARRAFREMRYDDVLEWAKLSWRKAGERQKKIDMQESGKKLAAKIERDLAREMESEPKAFVIW